jgi:serine/threonine protein kinase/Tol biopolymer transport system component
MATPSRLVGQTVSHYRVVEKVGSGGMGEVYRAQDMKLGREVAIKVLPDVFAFDPERLARFEREAQVLAVLDHPGIGAIYGLEEVAGRQYLILEFVPGQTLTQRLKGGSLPTDEALDAARQIAEALVAAHDKGIVHRDLKPANVKITPGGKIKVLDFGLARACTGEVSTQAMSDSPTLATPTRQDVILGTAAYMSPEQARGRIVDKRADIWAFGCVLYELLTGKQAYSGDTVTDTLAAVIRSEPDWKALPPTTPVRVAELVRRCLQKDALQRLRDIGDARIEIQEVLRTPLESQSAGVHSSGTSPRSRTRQALPWAVALAIAIIAGFLIWNATDRKRDRLNIPIRLVVALPRNQSVAVGANLFGGKALTVSPQGTTLAYVARHGTTTQLYLRHLDQFEPVPLDGTEGASGPFFSPDGQWVGFFADGKLKKISVAGGSPLSLCDAPAPQGATWAPDGTILFNPDWRRGLERVSATGGNPEVLTQPDLAKHETGHRWPEILPGGTNIIFTVMRGSSADEGAVAVLSLRTGHWKTIVEGGNDAHYLPTGHLIYLHAGSLLAVPFDLTQLSVTGTAVPLVDGILTDAAGGSSQYSITSNGTLAYILGGALQAERTLVWVDRNGQAQPVSGIRRAYEDLSLSPNGQQVALTIEGPTWNIWIYDLVRGTLTRLTFEEDNRDPLWTPDGKKVVYTSFRNGRYGLYWKAADGSGREELLVSSEQILWALSWSPDGTILVYGNLTPTGFNVMLLSVSGTRKSQVFLHTPYTESLAALSPDGPLASLQHK